LTHELELILTYLGIDARIVLKERRMRWIEILISK